MQHAGEDAHRVLEPRILGIRLDALEVGLGADALDLELRHEHHQVARRVARERHRTLGRQEAEVRQVADVVLVEDDIAVQPLVGDMAEHPLAPLGELCRGDAVRVTHQTRRSGLGREVGGHLFEDGREHVDSRPASA